MNKEEFSLTIEGDMVPRQDIFETESTAIPAQHTLHLTSVYAACEPMDEDGAKNCLQVDLLWREPDGEGGYVDHPVFAPIWTEGTAELTFENRSECADGTRMMGDGVTKKLVVRRTLAGSVGPQKTAVVVSGHVH